MSHLSVLLVAGHVIASLHEDHENLELGSLETIACVAKTRSESASLSWIGRTSTKGYGKIVSARLMSRFPSNRRTTISGKECLLV